MKAIQLLFLTSILMAFTSCAGMSKKSAKSDCCKPKKADHSCCSENKYCKTGDCQKGGECCKNKCGNCNGKKGDCGKNCELKKGETAKKDCKDGSCNLKRETASKKSCDLKKKECCDKKS